MVTFLARVLLVDNKELRARVAAGGDVVLPLPVAERQLRFITVRLLILMLLLSYASLAKTLTFLSGYLHCHYSQISQTAKWRKVLG